jgi:hypothetical protein
VGESLSRAGYEPDRVAGGPAGTLAGCHDVQWWRPSSDRRCEVASGGPAGRLDADAPGGVRVVPPRTPPARGADRSASPGGDRGRDHSLRRMPRGSVVTCGWTCSGCGLDRPKPFGDTAPGCFLAIRRGSRGSSVQSRDACRTFRTNRPPRLVRAPGWFRTGAGMAADQALPDQRPWRRAAPGRRPWRALDQRAVGCDHPPEIVDALASRLAGGGVPGEVVQRHALSGPAVARCHARPAWPVALVEPVRAPRPTASTGPSRPRPSRPSSASPAP